MNHVHEYHVFIIICFIFLKGIPLVCILCNMRVYNIYSQIVLPLPTPDFN